MPEIISLFYYTKHMCQALRGCDDGVRRFCFWGCKKFNICEIREEFPKMQMMIEYLERLDGKAKYSIKKMYCAPCRREIRGLLRNPFELRKIRR